MYNPPEDRSVSTSVSVESVDGKWVVTIVDNIDRLERAFEIESFAHSFADGQRCRLGIAVLD